MKIGLLIYSFIFSGSGIEATLNNDLKLDDLKQPVNGNGYTNGIV